MKILIYLPFCMKFADFTKKLEKNCNETFDIHVLLYVKCNDFNEKRRKRTAIWFRHFMQCQLHSEISSMNI